MCLYYIIILTVFIKGLELLHDRATRSYACNIAVLNSTYCRTSANVYTQYHVCNRTWGGGNFSICADRPRELLYKSSRTWHGVCMRLKRTVLLLRSRGYRSCRVHCPVTDLIRRLGEIFCSPTPTELK